MDIPGESEPLDKPVPLCSGFHDQIEQVIPEQTILPEYQYALFHLHDIPVYSSNARYWQWSGSLHIKTITIGV